MRWVKVAGLLHWNPAYLFLVYVFSLLINTAPPCSFKHHLLAGSLAKMFIILIQDEQDEHSVKWCNWQGDDLTCLRSRVRLLHEEFFSFFGRFCFWFFFTIFFTYIWLVSIYSYCWPVTDSRGVLINIFLVYNE